MGSPTSTVATEHPEPRPGGAGGSRGTPTAATPCRAARVDGHCQGPRPSEVPPTGALTWVLGELAFYYGACCLHYSAPHRGRTW